MGDFIVADLDDKLIEILDKYASEVLTGDNLPLQYAEKRVAQIKQLFKEYGWEDFSKPKHIEPGTRIMAGQLWYDRFEPLLEGIDLNSKTRYQELKEAAKKASGIK